MSLRRAAAGAVLAVALLAACASSGPTAAPKAAQTAAIPRLTRMICEEEAAADIGAALGVETAAPRTPTWIDHTYSCRYGYANGALRLSVKQLTDTAGARRYFRGVRTRLGARRSLSGLGEAAFTTAAGAVVVQKDDKVLVVDVHELPPMFGVPADTRANVAITVAATIMGCWTGE